MTPERIQLLGAQETAIKAQIAQLESAFQAKMRELWEALDGLQDIRLGLIEHEIRAFDITHGVDGDEAEIAMFIDRRKAA